MDKLCSHSTFHGVLFIAVAHQLLTGIFKQRQILINVMIYEAYLWQQEKNKTKTL